MDRDPALRCEGQPATKCRPAHRRRLLWASLVFALAVIAVTWAVGAFILRDLSESYVSHVISQAKGEAEALAALSTDPTAMGEPDEETRIEATKGSAIDPDALLDPLLPRMYDESGQRLDAVTDAARSHLDPPVLAPGSPDAGADTATAQRVPAFLERTGQVWSVLVDGQLVQRDAIHFISIRYKGGRSTIRFRKVDERYVDPAALADPTRVVQTGVRFRPQSQRMTIAWDSTLDGQPVQLEAGIDSSVLDEGVAELRRRIVPKVVAGGGAFVVLLGVAYGFVVRLLGEARRLEVEANEKAMLAQVGMLAAGLAHEIRNPLSAVQMNLQLLEEDLAEARGKAAPPAESGEDATLLRATQKEIRRLASLVTDFLTYARPAEPRRAPHDVDALVRDCIQLFEPTAQGAGVTLTSDLQAGGAPVALDEAMIKQALMNVIVNAMEAVPRPGGHVHVNTRRATGAVLVAVSDDGPGLPPDTDEIFRVFHSTKKGGTGLGLAISRALVQRHGGTLSARPGELGGARFVLQLPADAAA